MGSEGQRCGYHGGMSQMSEPKTATKRGRILFFCGWL